MRNTGDPSLSRLDVVAAAMATWREELTTLGGPNTLLWRANEPGSTFDVTVAHPSGVAKLLAGHRTLLSEVVREPTARREARERIRGLHAKTVELRTEHGVTSCFVAAGISSWSVASGAALPAAPVLLRGTQINPVDAAYQDFVLQLDRDAVFNPVLATYIRDEFGVDIDTAELVRLSSTDFFYPRATFAAMMRMCASIKGFRIIPQTVIGTYPWAKLDLVEHMGGDPSRLAEHDLIAALAGHQTRPAAATSAPGDPHDPQSEWSVLDADAPQREVISEVHHGASLVLDTPAGTGATQTVANVVADALAAGRTALVVSHERPALDALRRRLGTVGLDDVVLDLPEDRRRAISVISALAAQLDAPPAIPERPADPLPRWVAAQDVLAKHDQGMHTPYEPWGQSLAQTQAAMTRLMQRSRPPASTVRLSESVLGGLAGQRLGEVADVLSRAAKDQFWTSDLHPDPWFGATLLSRTDADRVQGLVAHMAGGGLSDAREQIREVCRTAGLAEPLTLNQWQQRIDLLARVHETSDHFRPQVYEAALDDFVAAYTTRDTVIDRSDAARHGGERMGTMARARLKRQVRTLLRPGKPPPDLPHRLIEAQRERIEWETLAGKAARPNSPPGWEQAQATLANLRPDLEWLRDVLTGTDGDPDLFTSNLDLLIMRLLRLDRSGRRVQKAADAYKALEPLRQAGLGMLVDDLASRGVAESSVAPEVEWVYHASLLEHIRSVQWGSAPDAEQVASARADFQAADREHVARNAVAVRRAIGQRLQRAVTDNPDQANALLDAASSKVGDLRAVIAASPDVVAALRPVMVGSPLIVPATLPNDLDVDVVIVEHAHRTAVSHAAAAIAHAKQTFIVGDSMREGPSAFSYVVARQDGDDLAQDGDDSAVEAATSATNTTVADTILHERSLLSAASRLLPVRVLDTHYRALDQRMVAPVALAAATPLDGYPGVHAAPRAHWRMQPSDDDVVSAAVTSVIDLLRGPSGRTVVVLTDEEASAEAVASTLANAARADRDVRAALDHQPGHAVRCMPLRRWAGEVCDHVVWARQVGRDVSTSDVATVLAAARRTVLLIGVQRHGVNPNSGGAAMITQLLRTAGADPVQASANPLIADLVARLRAEGLTVEQPVGRGRYAVPIGIEDPNRPGRMLVAIDVDTEPPSRGPDRDSIRVRPEQLSRLGWTPVNVLSDNLFRNPDREVTALMSLVLEAAESSQSASIPPEQSH